MTLPATEVQTLAEGNYAVNASVSDRAGNATSNSVNFTVDTGAPVVSVNTVAGDDILNNAEQAVAQIISGQVSGASPGDTVTVKLGTHVLTGVVLADGNATVTASVNDVAGNPSSVSRVVLVVLLALPLLVIPGLLVQRPLARLANEGMRESAVRNATLVEAVQSIEDIKLLRAEQRFQNQWNHTNDVASSISMKQRFLTGLLLTWTQEVQSIVYVVVRWWERRFWLRAPLRRCRRFPACSRAGSRRKWRVTALMN